MEQVGNEKNWDLKIRSRWEDMFGNNIKYFDQHFKFVYEGMIITSEDLGNITYGYMGSALGFGSYTLSMAGKIAGDDTDNQQDKDMVNYGIKKFFREYDQKYPVIWNRLL